MGEFQVDIPRNRNGEFNLKLIPKYHRDIFGIEEKVLFIPLSLWTAFVTKMREYGRLLSYVTYGVLDVAVDGYKDILSITVGTNESSKF